MATTEFIAAIELGSSKITGVAGKKNSDGSMQVLAYAQEDSSTFIRKGVIFNLDKTAQSLTSIINRLEGELKNSIAKVYVGIGGQSLRTVRNVVSRDLEEEAIISEELVSAIGDENIAIPVVDMDILDVAPQEYKVGNNLQANPVGLVGSHIEGRFLNIVARASVRKNLVPYVGNDFFGTGFDDIIKVCHFDDTVVILQFAGSFFLLFGIFFVEGVTIGFFQAFGFFLLHLQGGDVTRDAVASQR